MTLIMTSEMNCEERKREKNRRDSQGLFSEKPDKEVGCRAWKYLQANSVALPAVSGETVRPSLQGAWAGQKNWALFLALMLIRFVTFSSPWPFPLFVCLIH